MPIIINWLISPVIITFLVPKNDTNKTIEGEEPIEENWRMRTRGGEIRIGEADEFFEGLKNGLEQKCKMAS